MFSIVQILYKGAALDEKFATCWKYHASKLTCLAFCHIYWQISCARLSSGWVCRHWGWDLNETCKEAWCYCSSKSVCPFSSQSRSKHCDDPPHSLKGNASLWSSRKPPCYIVGTKEPWGSKNEHSALYSITSSRLHQVMKLTNYSARGPKFPC